MDLVAQAELKEIQRHLSIEENVAIQTSQTETFKFPETENLNIWSFAKQIYGVVWKICNELERHVDFPVSVKDAKKLHTGIRKAVEYGLKPFLFDVIASKETCLPVIIANINILLKITGNKFFSDFCSRDNQPLMYADIVSSIFVVISCGDETMKLHFKEILKSFSRKISLAVYFKILFLIGRGNRSQVTMLMQTISMREMKKTLYLPGSFVALCEALLPSITCLDQDEEIAKQRLHSCAVITNFIAKPIFRRELFYKIVDEINCHLMEYIRRNRSQQRFYVDAAVQCLSKLYALEIPSLHRHITGITFGWLEKLVNPPELLAGAIICTSVEFIEAIHLVNLTCCASGPSDDTLPSHLLIPYMPIFIQLHGIFRKSNNKLLKNEILDIIVRCLSNRDVLELNTIIESLLYENYANGQQCLHPRLQIDFTIIDNEEVMALIITKDERLQPSSADGLDFSTFFRSSTILIDVLKQCNHNTLIYNVFIHLLEMFSDIFSAADAPEALSSCELLGDEDELKNVIEQKFKRKYAVINTLNELILFKPFHGQISENPHKIIEQLEKMLSQQIYRFETNTTNPHPDDSDEVLIVILSVVDEFLHRTSNDLLKSRLEKALMKLQSILQTGGKDIILKKLDSILGSHSKLDESSAFVVAKAILSETHHEPYTKVYAIMNMIKLVNVKDVETCLNAHTVLALAIKMLREEDSYIFLNCIKLLICLTELMVDTVLETLIAEYHFDIDSDTVEIDFKLKVGETIVKVTQGLGEMCYKYKSILINCFLRGAYNQNDEFRTSNMSNLGTIMKILTYQVHHFGQEVCPFGNRSSAFNNNKILKLLFQVMALIQNTLQLDKYLPARRAATLILIDMLNGMNNLEQFQDHLLPIYRTLKHIEENDPDLHIQIHARNGLICLRDKIKEALTQDSKFEKKIQITNAKCNDDKPVLFKKPSGF